MRNRKRGRLDDMSYLDDAWGAYLLATIGTERAPFEFKRREDAERIAAYYVGRNNANRDLEDPDDPEHDYFVCPVPGRLTWVISGELLFSDGTVVIVAHLNAEAVANALAALDG